MMHSNATTLSVLLVSLLASGFTNAFTFIPRSSKISTTSSSSLNAEGETSSLSISGMWNAGNSFGKGQFRFYENFRKWIEPFPMEDREQLPEIFNFPKGVYEVVMTKPLGIIFEEIEVGKGVYVNDLVEGGMAETMGKVEIGDVLTGVTAVKVVGAKWERRLIPSLDLGFDTVVDAIGSNEIKWGCEDVVLQFYRPSEDGEETEAELSAVRKYMEFFLPPSDNPWVL